MESKQYYQLTNPQKTILLTEQYYKNTCINNVVGRIHFKENIKVELLKKTLGLLIEQNDVLRTRIVKKDNQYLQCFEKDIKEEIEIVNISDDTYASKTIRDLSRKHISMLNNSLVKFYILKYENGYADVLSVSHHIIADAWTVSMYAKEIIRIYNSLDKKENIDIIDYSYTNYINEENEYLESDTIETDKEYWNKEYSKEPSTQFFNSSTNIKGKRQHFFIEKEMISKIREYCKVKKISEQCLFMSVIAIYLSNIASNQDITIGMPVLNRKNYKNKRTMGMFIETLPFHLNVNGNYTSIEFLKYVAEKQYQLLKHHRYPYELLQKDIKNKFDFNQKLYSVAFSYQNAKIENSEDMDCETSWEFNGYCPDDLQIHISDMQDTGKFNIYYDYKVNGIEKREIENIHNRILNLVNQIIENDNIKIEDLEIVTPKEKNIIAIKFNKTQMKYDKEKTISEIIENVCEKYKNNIAVRDYNGNSITYSELSNKSNIVANYLSNSGIKSGDVVAVLLESKNINLITTILGILKLDASFILLYNGLPEERIKYILEDSKATAIITDDNSFGKFKDIKNIEISAIKSNNNKISIEAKPNDVAYLIYTSGTTGKPKGIEIRNYNLVNFVYSFNDKFEKSITDKDKFLSITNVSFDVSMSEIFTPLFFGATLFLYNDLARSTVQELVNYIDTNKITYTYFPPAILENVANELEKHKETIELNKMLVGVEPIKALTLEKFMQINENIKIINGYGPSETTICSTMYSFEKRKDAEEIVPIGSPIGNTKIYILNSNRNIVPIGVVGEIYITGDGVGKGYKNNELLTNEKYVIVNGERAFKTGDLAKWNKNGDIIFIGRNDNQIKFRGYRIDLGEIENSLKTFNRVNNAVVILNKRNNKDEKLIAFVGLKENDMSESSLRELLSKTLPYYMIPSKFIKVDNFPMTPNGKIDRKKLEQISAEQSESEVVILPENETEKIIYDLICEKLNKSKLSVTDNFFDIGIDSLEAISLIVEFERKNIHLSLQDFYNYPSIKMLSCKIEQEVNERTQQKDYLSKIKYIKEKETTISGNVLLLGATGFLGAHLLKELLNNTNVNVYCLVRAISKVKAKERLIEKLEYYFDDDFFEENTKRIKVINGDFTENCFGMSDRDYTIIKKDVTVIINSAACVKHFGNTEYFYNINYLSVKKALEFCKEENKQFIQISTMSVLENAHSKELLDETTLYANQELKNIYIRTKFEAEELIARAISNGQDATIFRLGNIMWREDAKFQINENENSFIMKLKTIIKFKIVPREILKLKVDFSPVDLCAKAIVSLLLKNKNNVYHIENNNTITIGELINILDKLNIKINVVDNNEFKKEITKHFESNEELMTLLENEKNENNISIEKTLNDLRKQGFKWNQVNKDYIKKYINEM